METGDLLHNFLAFFVGAFSPIRVTTGAVVFFRAGNRSY
jgi:hypothetical protein